MQARRLPAIRGWNWIVEGFRLFRTNPALLTFLAFGYFLTLAFLNLVPLVGAVAAYLCMPALSVGVMNGCRALERNAGNGFGLLYSGFRRNAKTLFLLGAAYMAGFLVVLALTALIDGDELWQKTPEELMRSGELMPALQLALLLTLPLAMAFWFAPMLAAWNDLPAAKALFFSFVACARNWRAFLAYGLGVIFISAVLPGIVLGILGVISEALVKMMAVAISLPLLFVFVPTLFASFYVSYRDVFVPSAGSADA